MRAEQRIGGSLGQVKRSGEFRPRDLARTAAVARACLTMGIAWLVAFGSGMESSHAQSCSPDVPPRRYHPRPLVKLGALGQCPDGIGGFIPFDRAGWYAGEGAGNDQLGVLAVNVHGEIVGTCLLGDNCTPRPFVYLPLAKYGKPAGWHDLIAWNGGAITEIGYAWDITDAGLVVGGKGGKPDPILSSTCRATAWDLSNGCQVINLDPTPPTPLLWSIAIAAEPFADPAHDLDIVGVGAQQCPTWRVGAAFKLTLGTAVVLNVNGGPAASSNQIWAPYVKGARNWACDIANLTSPIGAFDSPITNTILYSPTCLPFVQLPFGTCANPFQCGFAYPWIPSIENGFKREFRRDPNAPDFTDQITGLRSISHLPSTDPAVLDNIVAGYIRLPGDNPCTNLPSLWTYDHWNNAIPLATPNGYTNATAQRWREAKDNCGPDVVVGWAMSAVTNGIVWSRCQTASKWDFCVTAADGLTQHGGVEGGFDILQIYEVFDSGEILAIVKDPVSDPCARGYFAAILGLAGDFNRDGMIEAADFSAMLNAWGSAESMELDLNQDGVVGVEDVTMLLNLWTTGTPRKLALSCGAEFCIPPLGYAPGPTWQCPQEALAFALSAFGFESADDFRGATIDDSSAQRECMCQCLRCFMQIYLENEE